MSSLSFAITNNSGLKPYEVKADQPWGQTFRIGSGSGTATVNTIALGLYREPDAASQTITVSVRSSWNGSVLWQRTIPSSQLGQAANGTVNLTGITGLVLQQGQSYVLRLSSSTTDGKVYITASDGIGPYAQGAMLEKEGFAQEGDLRFSISGTLSAPTSPTPPPTPPTPPAPEPEPEPPIAEVLPGGELASAVVTSATREALQTASALNDSFIAVNLNFAGQDLSDLDLTDGYIRNVSFRGADLSNSKWGDINNFIPQNLPVPEQQQPDFELTTYLANTNWNLDFRGANLISADFTDAYLSGSNFSSLPGQITRLEKVKFDDSNLANASFRGVSASEISFQRADLRNADFTGADLRNALFQGADLTQANLANALLGGSNVTEAILIGANFTNAVIGATDFGKADFTGVNLQGANLQGASLQEVSFKAANLTGANLTGADLSKTDFTGANLRGANLRGAKLLEASFKDADFTGADLTGADLSKADFTGAILGSGSQRVILSGTVQVDTIGLGVDTGTPIDPTITAGQASFAIDGDPAVGELLEANQLSPDPDGDGSFAYLWQRSADGVQWITVGTEETYEVADADAGQGLRLVVTYLDGANNSETVITAPVAVPGGEAGIVNLPGPVEPPTIPPLVLPTQAQFAIEGLNQVGEELEAVQLTSDPDGDGSPTYLWQSSANNGASWTDVGEGEIYEPQPADAGKLLRVLVSYVDGAGNAETLTLSPGQVNGGTEPPLPPAEPVVDTRAFFTYDGLNAVGAELKAVKIESDPQGDGDFIYDWQLSSNGINWTSVGAEEVYAPVPTDVGQQLRVVITYVDGAGNPESITLPSSEVYADPSQLVETQVEPPVEPPTEPVTFDPGLVGTGDVAGFTAGADLRFQLIEKVEVIGANASGIRLTGATIKDSFFYDVDFSKASLRGVTLDGFNKSAPLGAPEVSLFSTFRLNFRGADLSFLQAKGTNFSGADFRNHADGTVTNLRAAQLPESNLSNANFTGVTAGGINLAKANLSGALLQGVVFAGGDLSETDLSGVNLSGANLQGINLSKANLTDANLSGANLTGAFLDGAILNGASLNGATLNGATLTNAQVLGADLRNSSLLQANLSASTFTGSNFGSRTSRADLTGAITLDAVGIDVSLFDVGASLPNQFLTEITVANVDATGMDLSGSVIAASFLYNVNLTNANLSNGVLAELNGSAPSGFFTTPPTSFELNFRNANLSGLTVIAGNLSGSDFSGANLSGAVFLGTNLTDANLSGVVGSSLVFQEAILLGVNFAGADFQGADFFELNLTGANFANADLRGANLAGAILTDANLSGANLEGADLSGANLSNAQLVGANLNGILFFEGQALGADLTGASLIGANLTGANFTGAIYGSGASRTVTTGAITTEAIGIEASGLDGGADLSNQFFEGLVVIDADLSGIDLSGSTISAGFFYNVNFSKADFSNTLFSGINKALPLGTTFMVIPTSFDLNLRGANFSGAVFEGFNFAGSDLRPATDGTATNFSGARFIEVIFADANLSGVNLRGANLSELDLSGINLSGADLRGANLSNTKLIGADLSGAQLDGALLDGAELTNVTAIGADFSGVSFVLGSALQADFEGANFSNATLDFSEFIGSYFGFGASAASFSGASQVGAEGLPGQPLDPPFEVLPPVPVEVSATETDPRFIAGADLSNRSFAELFVVNRNLSGINLSNSTFLAVYFAGVNFSGANLSGAYFSELSAEPPAVLATTASELVTNTFTNANLTGAIFSGGNLSGSSFSGATLTRVRFLATDLSGASFTGANAAGTFFREAILAGTSFQNANLAGADLSAVDLSGANLRGANLRGTNLSSAILDGADLTGADLTGAELFGATLLGAAINGALFTDANLVNADFTDATGSASFGGANLFGALGVPGAPGAEPEVGTLASDGRFSAGAQLANEVFNGIAVFGAIATGINLSGSRLLNAFLETVDFSGANLRGALFAQVNAELPLGSALADLPTSFNLNFANADLSGARLLASNLAGSNFNNANLAGIRLFESILTDSRFVGANLAGGVLVGADLSGVDFSGADLSGANLSGAILEGANLSGANLRNALLFEAVLTGANLNQTDFRGANLNAADLSGALNADSANFAGADLTDTIGADGAPLAEAGIGNLGPASFTISGSPLPGEIVSVDRTVGDPDGNGDGTFEVIWEATADGVVWEEVGEGVVFPVPPELAGLSLRAQVTYIDGFGNEEFVTVTSFGNQGTGTNPPVVPPILPNPPVDPPVDPVQTSDSTGSAAIRIDGPPTIAVASLLSAVVTTPDPDGNGEFSYTWETSDPGADAWSSAGGDPSFEVRPEDEGKDIRVVVNYVDGQGIQEQVISDLVVVPLVNDGAATYAIEGTLLPGNELQLARTAEDPDGEGSADPTIVWQKLDGSGDWITITSEEKLLLTTAERQAQVRAQVSYTDGQGYATTVITDPVAIGPTNQGVASYDIVGTLEPGQQLTVVQDTPDPDGSGSPTITWESFDSGSGTWIERASGDALLLAATDNNSQIRARVAYTDGSDFSEEVLTEEVLIQAIDAGAATFAITGGTTPGQTLTIDRTEDDPDGNGEAEWVVNWELSSDGNTWTPVNGDGASLPTDGSFQRQQVRATVAYTDADGFATTVTTEAIEMVSVNDGEASFALEGTVAVGEPLSAVLANSDPDGDGSFSYAWERSLDGETWTAVDGASGAVYVPANADQGLQLRARVTYTDSEGFSEEATTPVALVPLVNDGGASIGVSGLSDGVASVGSALTPVLVSADPDGMPDLGAFALAWQVQNADGSWSSVSSDASFTPGTDEEGRTLRLQASYTDGEGFSETVDSAPFTVPFVDAGTGSYAIDGTLRAGETLVAKREVDDPDGDGTETFTWQTSILGNWVAIGSGSTLSIDVSLAGRPLRLQVLTVDAEGHSATVFSDVVQVEPLDATLPVITGVTVAGNQLRLQFSEAVVASGLSPSLFSATVGGAVRAVTALSAVADDATRLTLTLAGVAPTSRQTVMLRYSDPSGNNLSGVVQDLAGNDLASTAGAGVSADTFSSSANVTNLAESYANLVLTGSAVTATGNGAANRITVEQTTAVANVINGGAGVDVMDGGNGGDIYLVADSSHHSEAEIVDSGATGSDELRFSSTIAGQTLVVHGGNIGLERVTIGTGTGVAASTGATTALNVRADSAANGLTIAGNNGANWLIGSNYADTIIGNRGNDTIEGGDGADTLTGGLGADVFRFASGIGGSGIDQITDFTVSQNDVIQLENSVFTALPTPGALAAAAFTPGAAATTAAHRIGYNPASGALWYDADGNGAGASITFAQLNAGLGLTAARFVVT